MDRVTFVYEIRLFCSQSEKCLQSFVMKNEMKRTTVNSVNNVNHPFCVMCAKHVISSIFRWHNDNRHGGVTWFCNKLMHVAAQNAFCLENCLVN